MLRCGPPPALRRRNDEAAAHLGGTPKESPLITRILVAIDHSDHSGRAAAFATELAIKFSASLTFLHVLTQVLGREQLKRYLASLEAAATPDPVQIANVRKELAGSGEAEGAELIGRAEAAARAAGAQSLATLLLDGDAATVILDQAHRGEHDVVVLGRRGMGSLKGLLTGSVSQKVASWGRGTVILVN